MPTEETEETIPVLGEAWPPILNEEQRVYTAEGGGPWGSTWSNLETAPPLTLEGLRQAYRWYQEAMEHPPSFHALEVRLLTPEVERVWLEMEAARPAVHSPWRWPDEQADNVTHELLELVRKGDEAGFRALAGCVMPAEDVEPCWYGAQARIAHLI